MKSDWKQQVYVMPSIVADVGAAELPGESDGTSMRLINRQGEWHGVSWPCVPLPRTVARLQIGEATVLDARVNGTSEPLTLVNWRPLDHTTVFDLIPEGRCPIDGIVTQTCDLIRQMGTPTLRSILTYVFTLPDVFFRYWESPASLAHHHSRPGGLAQHSLEVAVAAASVSGLDCWQRDMVVAYALLHDLGKIWTYRNGKLTAEARELGHEQLGYREMLSPLVLYSDDDRSTCDVLDELLSGDWKKDCKRPAAALGDIVRAMDRFSAACDMRNCPTAFG